MIPLACRVLEGSELHWVPKVHLVVLQAVRNLVLEVCDRCLEVLRFFGLKLELLGYDVYVALGVPQEILFDQGLLVGWLLIVDSDLLL